MIVIHTNGHQRFAMANWQAVPWTQAWQKQTGAPPLLQIKDALKQAMLEGKEWH